MSDPATADAAEVDAFIAAMSSSQIARDPGASWSHLSVASGAPSHDCLADPFILGVDEAGRGPVLGPMVYAVAFGPAQKKDEIKGIGVDDSKKLSEGDRRRLFAKMTATDIKSWLGFSVTAISPRDISNGMLARTKYNLNQQAYDTTISLIRGVLNSGVNVKEIYVDTVGKEKPYQAILEKQFPGIAVTVATKADSKYPIVSAASIFAKVIRDYSIKNWTFIESSSLATPFTREFGSGYPGDPNTRKWLKENLDPIFGFPDVIRFSWATCAKILEKHTAEVMWPDDDGEGIGDRDGNIRNFFKTTVTKKPSSVLTDDASKCGTVGDSDSESDSDSLETAELNTCVEIGRTKPSNAVEGNKPAKPKRRRGDDIPSEELEKVERFQFRKRVKRGERVLSVDNGRVLGSTSFQHLSML